MEIGILGGMAGEGRGMTGGVLEVGMAGEGKLGSFLSGGRMPVGGTTGGRGMAGGGVPGVREIALVKVDRAEEEMAMEEIAE